MSMFKWNVLLQLLVCATISACGPVAFETEDPSVVVQGDIGLPSAPIRALTVGVYNCLDTSGQRAFSATAELVSYAVPQDCSPYLISALKNIPSGYLNVVERGSLSPLLQERNIGESSLRQFAIIKGKDPASAEQLGPLKVAEIIFIGQVISYDNRTRQVSAGLAVGGLGASRTETYDTVTFGVRAVSVQSGEVLSQIQVTKTITSSVDNLHKAAIYTKTVLDAEAGGSRNEPVGQAISSAARAAVIAVVEDGIRQQWWKFAKK